MNTYYIQVNRIDKEPFVKFKKKKKKKEPMKTLPDAVLVIVNERKGLRLRERKGMVPVTKPKPEPAATAAVQRVRNEYIKFNSIQN